MTGYQKNINLLEAYNYKPRDQKKLNKIGMIALPIILVVVIAVVFVMINLKTATVQAQIDELYTYTQAEDVVAEFQLALDLRRELGQREAMVTSTSSLKEQIANVPALYVADFKEIQKSGPRINFTGFSFSADRAVLIVVGRVRDYNDIPKFVISLKDKGIFENVTYYGYKIDDDKRNTDYQYGFTATCSLKVVNNNG